MSSNFAQAESSCPMTSRTSTMPKPSPSTSETRKNESKVYFAWPGPLPTRKHAPLPPSPTSFAESSPCRVLQMTPSSTTTIKAQQQQILPHSHPRPHNGRIPMSCSLPHWRGRTWLQSADVDTHPIQPGAAMVLILSQHATWHIPDAGSPKFS